MTLHEALDQPALFRFTDPHTARDFSARERKLLVGALNFHALMAPGRTMTVHLYDSDEESSPHTTDDATFDGLSRDFRRRIASFEMVSLVSPEERMSTAADASAEALASNDTRHLVITPDKILTYDPYRPPRSDLIGRVARRVKSAAPLVYDDLRDLVLLRHRRRVSTAAPRRKYEEEFRAGGLHEDATIVPAGPAISGAPRAVILGLHWFELGGAELWAFESVRLVREAGFLPIVLTNKDSQHAWIARAELEGALVIPFSEPTVESQTPGTEQVLRGILRNFDVRGIVVHHNQWLYDRLHWVALSRPDLPVVDSTHIVEHGGGGYPLSSARVSDAVSTHHVISPGLAKWMTDVQKIPTDRVVMAPLGGLTVTIKDARFRARNDDPFTVVFVGRLVRQKAPEVFVAMAQKLKRSGRTMRFILHGDGDLGTWFDDVIESAGLTDEIIRRTSKTPVAETLDEAHLLVVSSHNEGLTLTTLEAIAHGVPVVSTDVGAQSDIVPREALVPRYAHAAARGLADIVARYADDESARESLWRAERKAEKKLLAHPSASAWFKKEVGSW